jgi:hypothetical protein
MIWRARALALAITLLGLPSVSRADDVSKLWRTIETEHFHIVYYVYKDGRGEEQIAQRLAVIAEESHKRLVPFLGTGQTKRRKTWVEITDDTDDFNGSATVLPYPLIRLYATSPDDRAELNDYDDWLRGLFLHEYTHILHIGTIGGPCAKIINWVLGWGLGNIYAPNQLQPRFIIEGLAVFEESERSSGGRLRNSIWDMYLRAQTLENQFMTLAQITHYPIQFPDANAAYLYGSALMRYVAKHYGQDNLRRMYEDYGSNCLPGAISRSLKRTMPGVTWPEVYDGFRAELLAHYTAQRDAIARRGITPTRTLLSAFRPGNLRAAFLPDGNEVIVPDSDGYTTPEFRRVEVATGKWHHDLYDERFYVSGGPSLSADGRRMVFHAANPWHTFYNYNDLWFYDRVTKEKRRLTDGLRATNPGISPDGKWVAYEVNDATARGLGLMELDSGRQEMLIPARNFEQVYTPVFSPDGKTIAFSWWREGGYRDIWTMDVATRKLEQITNDRAIDMEPRYSPDGKWLYFVSDRTEVHNLYAYELATKKLYQASNVVNGLFDPAISPDGKRVVFSGFSAQGYTLETAELDPAKWWEAAPALLDRPDDPPPQVTNSIPSHRYNPFWTIFPWTFGLVAQPDGYGELIGIKLSGADVVGHHSWATQLAFGTGRSDDVNWSFNYAYLGLWPSFNLGVGHSLSRRGGMIIDGVDVGYDEDDWSFGTSIGLPLLRRALGNVDLSLSYSLSYAQNLSKLPPPDPSQLVPQLPEVGRTAGVGLGVSFYNSQRFRYSVSNERGREVSLYVSVGSKYLGSQHEVYAASWHWNEYFPMPWKPRFLRNHVLAVSYSGGISGGDPNRRAFFAIGGYPQQDLLRSIYDFSRPGGASLRGYPYQSVVGDQFHVLNLEYRFPITWIEWGYQHSFLYLRRLHGKVFADYGGAFSDGFSFDKMKTGVGAELILELIYAWYFPAALQLGYAYGIDKGGSNQVYFLLNNPF